jgi:hypothetical protein
MRVCAIAGLGLGQMHATQWLPWLLCPPSPAGKDPWFKLPPGRQEFVSQSPGHHAVSVPSSVGLFETYCAACSVPTEAVCASFRLIRSRVPREGHTPGWASLLFPPGASLHRCSCVGSSLCLLQFQKHRWTVRFPCGHPGDYVEVHVGSWEPRAELAMSVSNLPTTGPPALSLKKRQSASLITVSKSRAPSPVDRTEPLAQVWVTDSTQEHGRFCITPNLRPG